MVEVDPATGALGVEAELDGGSISYLSDRDETTHDAPTGWRSPSLNSNDRFMGGPHREDVAISFPFMRSRNRVHAVETDAALRALIPAVNLL